MQIQPRAPQSTSGACRGTALPKQARNLAPEAPPRGAGAALCAITSFTAAAQRRLLGGRRLRERRRAVRIPRRSSREEDLTFGLESELIVKVPPYDRRKIGARCSSLLVLDSLCDECHFYLVVC
eukprot:symbB.v1.2.021544.t1/scaffold1866.1/size97981/2